MNKKYAFLLSLIITLLIASNYFLLSAKKETKLESAIISRVIDGDTIVLSDQTKIRLLNVNAPEKEFTLSNASIFYLKQFENHSISIDKQGIDKYKRTLARIYSPSYINLDLVSNGLANKFLVIDSELKDFDMAEKIAIESQKGIWKKSQFYGCLSSKIDFKKEIISLKNSCPEINFSGFLIKDESRKYYKFDMINFSGINIHSKNGEDNSTDLFWNSKTDIWNNDRDTLYLFDSGNNIVLYYSYGY
jgi:micrococcal nuclease